MKSETLAKVAALVQYEPETGLFTRKSDGQKLGTDHIKGYIRIKIGSMDVLAHRLAWFIATGKEPEATIDHINRDKQDNRLCNLRQATHSQNQCNRGPQKNCASGVSGVAMNRQKTGWQAYIKLNGKRVHLGTFKQVDDAIRARMAAQKAMFGEFSSCSA